MAATFGAICEETGLDALDAAAVYREHADFVWRVLLRLGVPRSDVEDLTQDVFIVVHSRLASYDHQALMTTWLFGICLRVAARHRRRAWFRRVIHGVPEQVDRTTPEDATSLGQDRARLAALLDTLKLEHRAVFVLFELEERSCDEIAELMEIPKGTVFSRLHKARIQFRRALERLEAREQREVAHG